MSMALDFPQLSHLNSDRPLGGRYRLTELLGEGGFGHTFLARDLHLPHHPYCVIKQLKPQARDSETLQTARRLFETEAQVLYQLGNHDQIPRLLAHFEDNQEFYLALEFIEGEPLTEGLASGKPWSEASVIALLQNILQVLTFVHQQNVIHRDVKPSNLLRRHRDGKIVLIDFGAVKQTTAQLADPDAEPTVTISIGTPGYLPNEQMAGNPRFSSDVYAVGMVGIQALTGIKPKKLDRDPHTGEIVWHHLVPQLSPELAAILDRMVRYYFKDRYQTAVEALQALESLIEPHRNLASAIEAAPFPLNSVSKESAAQNSDCNQQSFVGLPKRFQGSIVAESIKQSLSEFRSTLTLQKPRLDFAASRLAAILQNVRPTPRKVFLGIGLLAIATVVPFSNLHFANRDQEEIKPNFRSAAVAPSMPPLPCNEPPPPPLPDRSPDHEYHDGTKYYGKFVNGIPANGRGIMLFRSGNRYDGGFRDGKRNGCGTLTFANGRQYMGQFQNDHFNGQGVWVSGNGDRYIGAFKDNKCHGKGVLIFPDGTFQSGAWQNGKLIGKNLSCTE
jgi:serine/threonine protein kinase